VKIPFIGNSLYGLWCEQREVIDLNIHASATRKGVPRKPQAFLDTVPCVFTIVPVGVGVNFGVGRKLPPLATTIALHPQVLQRQTIRNCHCNRNAYWSEIFAFPLTFISPGKGSSRLNGSSRNAKRKDTRVLGGMAKSA
jgi:hypothetical protein